jgi:hypothetical protein
MLTPVVMPLARVHSGHKVQRLMGFWACWHMSGGYRGLLDSGCWAKSGLLRQKVEFRQVFGMTVEEAWPEVTAALVAATKAAQAEFEASTSTRAKAKA